MRINLTAILACLQAQSQGKGLPQAPTVARSLALQVVDSTKPTPVTLKSRDPQHKLFGYVASVNKPLSGIGTMAKKQAAVMANDPVSRLDYAGLVYRHTHQGYRAHSITTSADYRADTKPEQFSRAKQGFGPFVET